ncbi:dipeptidyl peptidase IV N-terminal region-domain-containing protein [Phlyctochytrium arcticum]|nr:dipeptidyl peptidase IV N-terminal region-domain-containing protein [Phlyctochytrium arcticum]
MAGLSWDAVRTRVRAFHAAQSGHAYPHQRDFTFDEQHGRIYFLGSERRATTALTVTPLEGATTGPSGSASGGEELRGRLGEQASKTNGVGGHGGAAKGVSLFAITPWKADSGSDEPAELSKTGIHSQRDVRDNTTSQSFDWIPIVTYGWLKHHNMPGSHSPSKEEELINVRKRISNQGITAFQLAQHITHADGTHIPGSLFFTYGGGLYVGTVQADVHDFDPIAIPIEQCEALDPQLGGAFNDIAAYISNRNLYACTLDGHEVQLTFTDFPGFTNGMAEYIAQEEFRRFTGYWWKPVQCRQDNLCREEIEASGGGICQCRHATEHILFMRNDHSGVETIYLPRPGMDADFDEYMYPRPGKQNVYVEPHIIEIERISDRPLRLEAGYELSLQGQYALRNAFPWMEYIVRAGWLPTGNGVWFQLVDRLQHRTSLIAVPIELFMNDMEYETHEADPNRLSRRIHVLVEDATDYWINVDDLTTFWTNPDASGKIEFVWASERTGYRHIYHGSFTFAEPVRVTEKEGSGLEYCNVQLQQLTSGEWAVMDRPIFVDKAHRQVYFTARKDLVTESHIYVTRLPPLLDSSNGSSSSDEQRNTTSLTRLSQLGASHHMTMDQACQRYVNVYSSIQGAPNFEVGGIIANHGPQCWGWGRPVGTSTASTQDLTSNGQVQVLPSIPQPEFFSFQTSDGIQLFGHVYYPETSRTSLPPKKHPTILRIYGGPNVQTITNDYKHPKLSRVFLALKFGFCVVMVDGRGSNERGVEFEGFVKGQIGTVELRDQIEALLWLTLRDLDPDNGEIGSMCRVLRLAGIQASIGDDLLGVWNEVKNGLACNRWPQLSPSMDLDRLGITGWSYGGYLSLMGLAQYPSIFKLCLAGAPVTCWELYDSAYTERYIGTPTTHPQAYRRGRVMEYIDGFPDTENRLLIVHGLRDENVHFKHTQMLVSALVKRGKPHQVQIYPTERHALRSSSAVEHFETLSSWWFGRYL